MKVKLQNKLLPLGWKDKLILNQEIGGVFLVFLSGKTQKVLNSKVSKLKAFCKSLKKEENAKTRTKNR